MLIREFKKEDWDLVKLIYQEGIDTGDATFNLNAPSFDEWDKNNHDFCRFILENKGCVVGWVALSKVSNRSCYSGVAEVSLYIAEKFRGQGLGKKLLHHLILESEAKGIWTLQAGIFPENKASIALHKSCGFREVGIREKLGEMHGIWRDVILMERRSKSQ